MAASPRPIPGSDFQAAAGPAAPPIDRLAPDRVQTATFAFG